MKVLKIYSDGGCRGNGEENNLGAYGAVLLYGDKKKEISKAVPNTTNNIMELTGAIEGLKAVKDKQIPVELHTDSNYVVQGMNSWVKGWKAKGWKKAGGKPVANQEQWMILDKLAAQFNDLKFFHVKGHNGHPLNERADTLCNMAMDKFEKEGACSTQETSTSIEKVSINMEDFLEVITSPLDPNKLDAYISSLSDAELDKVLELTTALLNSAHQAKTNR